jgi:hypothetical protein
VRRLHAERFIVRVWGVADEALMRQVVDAGADGMTVNCPDKLLASVKSASRLPYLTRHRIVRHRVVPPVVLENATGYRVDKARSERRPVYSSATT